MPEQPYTCLRVSGEDREGFLQGQLTQDIRRLADEPILRSAWCSPKGRVITLLTLVRQAEEMFIFLPSWQAEEFRDRILRYRLRSDVTIDNEAGMHAVAMDTGAGGVSLPSGARFSARRQLDGPEPPVMELFLSTDALETVGAVSLDARAWRLARIRAGQPELHSDTVEAFTPHMLNLDLLDTVSFAKGCYTGQEVVARTENLGRPSRRTLAFRVEADPPAAASRLLDEAGASVGSVLSAAQTDDHSEFLAVVSIKALGGSLRLESGETVSESVLPYSVPELELV